MNATSGQKLIPDGYGSDHHDEIVVWANKYEELPGGKRWSLEPTGNGSVRIRNRDTDKCLAVAKNLQWGGRTAVVQSECRNSPSVEWDLRDRGTGYMIVNRAVNKAITPFDTGGNYWVVLDTPGAAANQLWNFPVD
ncbi:RICIN domain-containing protein [Streptomyces sp. UH6]|uniref:RICIN domain-containing protein n=1 Tax=Streptomyces sp. UH6 TaxID=2748379 RepID=UPI0015D4B04F|nr:RICIN domain-containing protein [Streptomyces sp. UH6]NYV72831.1 RICIN domain-containing protein [Streptomyces sp. UH6]